MYCKYCGKEIADDSKFCSNCGKALNGQKSFVFKSKCYKLLDKFHINKTCGYIYGLWLSLNLTLWLFRDSCYENDDLDCFYPEYGLDDISIYDIREFIFYVFLLPFQQMVNFMIHIAILLADFGVLAFLEVGIGLVSNILLMQVQAWDGLERLGNLIKMKTNNIFWR